METSPKTALAVALEGAGWHPAARRLPGVPILQEDGRFRAGYAGPTLGHHLGLRPTLGHHLGLGPAQRRNRVAARGSSS
jgi:hypothetical protein